MEPKLICEVCNKLATCFVRDVYTKEEGFMIVSSPAEAHFFCDDHNRESISTDISSAFFPE